MTAAETHIRVNQRYQEIASNKRDNFFPEEIDLALNTAQDRFLIKKVEAYLQDKQTDLAAVSPLVVKNKSLAAISPATSDSIYEKNMVYSVIPANLKFLINSRADILTTADGCEGTVTLTPTTLTEWVAIVPFPVNGAAPFCASFQIERTAGVLYNVAGTSYNSGFSNVKGRYRLINGSLDFFNNPSAAVTAVGLQVYWERYREIYYKDSYIFVSPTNLGTFTASVTSASSGVAQSSTSYSTRTGVTVPATLILSTTETKPTEGGLLYKVQTKNRYYKSRAVEPIVHQTQDYLMAYHDESFLVVRQAIDYIRKPRQISLALNQSCELEAALPEIIDLAVEILRLDTKDNSYPQTVQDTELRNKL